MKLFQILIALLILTVSASVYAMSIYIPPLPFNRTTAVELNAAASVVEIKKISPAERKIKSLFLQQRFNRLLTSSS